MMSTKARFTLVLAATIAFYSVLVLLALSLDFRSGSIANVAFPVLIILGVVPIYPLFRTLRKRPGLSALAILLVIASVISGLASLTGSLVLSQDVGWIHVAATLSEALFIISCVLFIWNGAVRRHRH